MISQQLISIQELDKNKLNWESKFWILFYLKMGRKKIQKAPKTPKEEEHDSEPEPSPEPEPQVEAPKAKKGGRAKKESSPAAQLNLFSDTFNDKVDRFKRFYEDFLAIKSGSSDATSELNSVNERVASKLENACSDVLREDLQDAERWIGDQQINIVEQINSTQKAIEATKTALAAAGTFSDAEIDNQVAGIIAKEEKLKQKLQAFEDLKTRTIEIYQTQKIDEQ